MSPEDDLPEARIGGGGRLSRRKLEAQASTMRGSGVKLRRKDLRQQRAGRRKARKEARRELTLRRIAIVGCSLLVIALGGLLIHVQSGGCREDVSREREVKDKGHFLCENCGAQWDGEAVRSHPYDPYVQCRACGKRKARRATQCPQCRAWVLEQIPTPPRPFAEMNKGEKRQWDLQKRSIMRKAQCPECGALLHASPPPPDEVG